ncbi:MAG: CDC50/LEM3 family protein [archaeon]|nr:CDC50/LEM3 family protein [archaeon]
MQVSPKPPSNTAFKQQRLKACQPIFTPAPVILMLFLIGAAFVAIGAALVAASVDLVETSVRYDKICTTGSSCTVVLNVPKKMLKPVYFYYQLNNYYQNHRRYVSSRSDTQLRGDRITSLSAVDTCNPDKTFNDTNDINDLLLPCGLIAVSTFNDSFTLQYPNGTAVEWTTDGIAWQSDIDKKFKPIPDGQAGIVIQNQTDPHFINWMRTAALPTFKKLYTIIHSDLEAGPYNLQIDDFYDVSSFDGEKRVVLSEISWLGGKNDFLGVTYLVIAGICLVFAIAFWIAVCVRPRQLGDISGVKRFEMH